MLLSKPLGNLHDFIDAFQPKPAVLLVGSGPSLSELSRVDRERYTVITMNGACQALRGDVYTVMNPDCQRCDWWFPDDPADIVLLSQQLSAIATVPHYKFQRKNLKFIMRDQYNVFVSSDYKANTTQVFREMTPDLIYNWGTIYGTILAICKFFKNITAIHAIGCDFKDILTAHGVPNGGDMSEWHHPVAPAEIDAMELMQAEHVISYMRTDFPHIDLAHYGKTKLPIREI